MFYKVWTLIEADNEDEIFINLDIKLAQIEGPDELEAMFHIEEGEE